MQYRNTWVSRIGSAVLTAALVITSAGTFVLAEPRPETAQALTQAQLEAQKRQAEEAARKAAAQAAEQKRLADLAAKKVQEVSGQISTLESGIQTTQASISQIQQGIEQKNQEIASLEADLRVIQDQQDALVRQLYIVHQSSGDALTLFSSDGTISERERKEAQFTALKKSVALIHSRTMAAKLEVEKNRNDLQQKSDELVALQAQQNERRSSLSSVRAVQQELQRDAIGTAKKLDQEAAAQRDRAAKIEQQLRTLRATSSWGSQIVSGSTAWYYRTQTGNYTKLGNSVYTVHDYGCLITSIAMLATYHGRSTTPTEIAQNPANFTSQGYLIGGRPIGLGINVGGSVPVNWSTVNSELANGRPVIVSIYLPSVGAVNPDGSSHFVVIDGVSNGKYWMQDPIGPGRGYNLNQVRSMKIVRPN